MRKPQRKPTCRKNPIPYQNKWVMVDEPLPPNIDCLKLTIMLL
ncbi:MAG: hypothetical protein PHN55_08995 [Dysgonamonadaceae bacterium]|nr:hypothetical protein [Dysgonamonadaceae bacterium]